MDKFKKDTTNNPVDWFNINGTFEHIFSLNKNYYLEENNVKIKDTIYYIINDYTIIDVKNDKIEKSKFHFLVKIRFKDNFKEALNYVQYDLQKNEFPFIRVGIDYYKIIKRTDRFGGEGVDLKQWNKVEIKQDYKDQFHLIKYYDDFTIIPDNVNYRQSINGMYNQYPKFCHKPYNKEVTESDIPYTIKLLKHLFGEQYDLGLKYMNVLYTKPQQAQYILCFVSEENNTGKTTFIDLLQMIFANASIQISPSSLGQSFNYIYATKNIILIEEAVTEKTQTVETLKALSTQKNITVNRKNVSEYEIPFFGKFVMCTNKVDDFIRINDKETRFWVRKVNEIPDNERIVNINELIFQEIPKFLKFLLQMPEVAIKHRMVFLPSEIDTIWTKRLKKESYSGLHKKLYILFREFFNDNPNDKEVKATDVDIKEKWFKHDNTIGVEFIRKTLKNDFKKIPTPCKYKPFGNSFADTKNQRAFTFYANDFDVIKDIDIEEDEIIPF